MKKQSQEDQVTAKWHLLSHQGCSCGWTAAAAEVLAQQVESSFAEFSDCRIMIVLCVIFPLLRFQFKTWGMKHTGTPFLDASVVLPWLHFWHAFSFMFSTDFIAPDCELNGLVRSLPSRRNWGRSDLSRHTQWRTMFHLCLCTGLVLHSYKSSQLGIWNVQMVFLLRKKTSNMSLYVSFIKWGGNSAEACFRVRRCVCL